MMLKKLLYATAVLFLTAFIFTGKSGAVVISEATSNVSVAIVPSVNQINPADGFSVLVRFTIADGWHILAQNPGDAGMPTTILWSLPEGYRLINEKWSPFKTFGDDVITQYGYDDTAEYTAEIVPEAADEENASFTADISWLACNDECFPEKVRLEFSLPLTEKAPELSQDWLNFTKNTGPNVLTIMLMAFIGGIILNFMPCIFPVLTIKAISLVQSRNNLRTIKLESLLYLLGVVVSFLIIASVLIFLRLQGEYVGWGFQLQSPVFVAIMLGIFIVIFLMLLDVVNIKPLFADRLGRLSLSKRKINAFLTGFFAVLIASPCTAPFMGIAVGYTLSQPIYVYYPVFLALGLGYALPFTMIGFCPRFLSRMLPKPGKWMVTLKKVFAIPVFLTCIWLLWVLNSQVRVVFVPQEKVVSSLNWEVYDVSKVSSLVADGKPVFVDFTAKWCITCLANERMALETEVFRSLVKDKGIHIFKADWTNDDENITKALEMYGRNSIPLYVYYNGKNGKYVILPQLLTPGIMEEYLK